MNLKPTRREKLTTKKSITNPQILSKKTNKKINKKKITIVNYLDNHLAQFWTEPNYLGERNEPTDKR